MSIEASLNCDEARVRMTGFHVLQGCVFGNAFHSFWEFLKDEVKLNSRLSVRMLLRFACCFNFACCFESLSFARQEEN